MYEVFFNDRTVFLNTDLNKSNSGTDLFYKVSSADEIPEIWNVFVNDAKMRNLFLTADSPEKLEEYFLGFFKIIVAAGGLVFNRKKQLLCIKRWGKWDLPKGKAEKHETVEETALREVKEETGLKKMQITDFKSVTRHVYQSPYHNNAWVLKETYWYIMKCKRGRRLKPQTEEDITEVRWFDIEQLDIVRNNTYASLKSLFNF